MAYTEDVNVNLNLLAGTMGGVTAIMGGMSALTSSFGALSTEAVDCFGAVDGLLATSTALIVSFGVQAAEAFGEFEQGMKIVQAVSGQAQYSIAQLGEQANQLSVHYRTAIGDITEGLQTLGRAGLNSAATQIEVLESGLQTAKLEGRNLNAVLEEIIQNTAMLGGDLKSIDFGEQSSYLNSLMVGTSMTAPINSHDISQTLQYAGGTAAAAGANLENKDKLEDLMGTIAAFAQKGVKGSMSGTALRAFFTKPASQDTSVTDALGSIGLSPEDLWENGGNSMKKVSEQISIIKRRMDALHLSTMDQVELWGKIVGPKMGQQMMKLDASSVRELTTDIQNAQSAQDLANKTLDTYNQKISSLSQQGQIAYRELGEKAVTFLTPVIDILNLLAQFASNPAGNMTIWVGGLMLLGHGLRAAWGIASSVMSQIKGLVMSVIDGMDALTGSTHGFSDGLTQSASRADLLNLKLKETNSTMQAIQGAALGIKGFDWVANGGAMGSKVDKGVISSMARNMYVGATSKNGINFGVPGQYYRPSDKAGLEQQMKETSAQNKANVDRVTAVADKLAAEIQRVEGRLSRVNDRISNYREIAKHNPAIDKANEMFPRTAVSDERGALRMLRVQRQTLEDQLARTPKDDTREKLMKQSGVTEADVEETRKLIAAKKELERKLEASQNAYVEAQVEWASKQTHDAKGEKIRSSTAYTNETRKNAPAQYWTLSKKDPFGRERKQIEQELEKVKYKLSKNLDALKVAEMKEGNYEQIASQIEEIKKLEAEIEQTSGENLQKLILKAKEERESVLVSLRSLYASQGALPTEAALQEMYPQMSDKEIRAFTKELTTELQTQIQIVEEEVYQAEMARLHKLSETSPIAAQTFKDNMELEDAGVSKVEGVSGYRQMIVNNPAPEKQSEIVGMAMKNQATQNATKMAQAMEQASIQSTKQMQGVATRIRNKLQQTGQSYLSSWGNVLNTGASKIGIATKSVEFSLKGLAMAIPEASVGVQAVSEEFAMSAMTFEEAMAELTAATGLTSEQISMIALSGEAAAEEWITAVAAMVAADDQEIVAIENLIRAKMAEAVAEGGGAAAGVLGKLKGGFESVTGFMGGPFMVAMMGITFIMQGIQASQRAWQEEMQKATEQLSEATDKMDTAKDKIKDIYSSENTNLSEANLDKAVDQQFATVADTFYGTNGIGHYETNRDDLGQAEFEQDVDLSGKINEETGKYEMLTEEQMQEQQDAVENITLAKDENVQALNENTMALMEATAAYNQAEAKQAKQFDDASWGANSITANITDKLGEWQEEIWNVGSWLQDAGYGSGQTIDRREGFLDSNSPVLTGSQADSNYAGSTDFAAIFGMDVMRFGTEKGLQQFFGSDFDRIMSLMGEMDNKLGAYGTMGGKSALMTHAENMASMDPDKMALAQMHLKNNPEDFQKLAKQSFRYEQQRGLKSGHTAYEDWSTGKLRQRIPGTRGNKNAYKEIAKNKYTVRDKNMDTTLKKLMAMTDNKLSYQNILALGQLQQLQDMYQVASESVAPGIMQTVQGVYSNISATGAAAGNAGNAASGAASAASNAAAIATLLGAQAQGKAEEAAYDEWKRDSKSPQTINGVRITDKDTFVKAISKGGEEGDKWQSKVFQSLAGGGWSLNHPGASPEYIKKNAERLAGSNSELMKSNASYQDKLNTATRMIVDYAQGATLAAYDQSSIGEYGGGDRGGSSGSGGGGGDGGSGSDKGNEEQPKTRKERVDLVLCNKKEIPKLNVNLFKKPPNFTVLNKNFKLRDIKINSQDKPKAIMNAIKNGIIETQKRMDPKIIQDESAEFNPVDATEGNSVPQGNTKTTT